MPCRIMPCRIGWHPAGDSIEAGCLGSGGFGVLINAAFRELRECLVGLLFLRERSVEKLDRLVKTQFGSPGFERAVAGDLIVLDRLGGCQQTGVERGLCP